MKSIAEEGKCKAVFVANININARNTWTDQKYMTKNSVLIFSAISSSHCKIDSYLNDIKFAYSKNLTSLNKSILIYVYYITTKF
jgi:hypothetical protein